MRRLIQALGAAVLALGLAAGSVSAVAPEKWTYDEHAVFTWEVCDGFDLIGEFDYHYDGMDFFGKTGEWTRTTYHATDTGTLRRSDTNQIVGWYTDKGGQFTNVGDLQFTWVGVIDRLTMIDGYSFYAVGRQKVVWTEADGYVLVQNAGRFNVDGSACAHLG